MLVDGVRTRWAVARVAMLYRCTGDSLLTPVFWT